MKQIGRHIKNPEGVFGDNQDSVIPNKSNWKLSITKQRSSNPLFNDLTFTCATLQPLVDP